MSVRGNPWACIGGMLAAILAGGAGAQDGARMSRNEAVELTVSAVRTADGYGPLRPPAGRKFLVISTEWRNLLPPSPVDGKLTATPYLVPALDQQLFLIAGGRIAPFAAVEGRPGVLPARQFSVPDPSSPSRGNLVFEVPPDAADLLLVFVDERHGAMTARLSGEARSAPAAGQRTEKNEILEAWVAGQRAIEDPAAPAETETIAIDLRLRSVFQPDRKARCARLVSLPDWQDRYVQLLVDGTYATALVSGPFGAAAAAILPEASTGGEFVFRVPRRRASVDLVLYFGEMPTAAGKLRPRQVKLPVKLDGGAPAAEPRRAPIVSARDAIFDIAIVGVSAVDEFSGAKPAAGMKFLVVDATVTNIARQPEVFQGLEQLKRAGEGGEATAVDPATFAGPRPPLAQLHVPAGEVRTFQLVFAIPAGEARPRIAYSSVTAGASRVLELPSLGAAGIAKAAAPTPPRKPAVEGTAAAAGPGPPPAVPTAPSAAPSVPARPMPAGETPSAAAPVARETGDARPDPKKLPARIPARQTREPKGLAGVGLRTEDVNAAIDRGAGWLWTWIRTEELKGKDLDTFGERPEDVLYSLALVHAGYQKKSVDFDGALRGYLTRFESYHYYGGYHSGLICMLVESYDPTFIPQLRLAARYLLEAQGPQGTWDYTANLPKEIYHDPNLDRVLQVFGGEPLDGTGAVPWKRLTDPSVGRDGDNSVSQFALLGLHAASRLGVPIPADVWKRNLDAQRARQQKDGGWGYTTSGSYGSMTCAGICATAIDRHELGEKDIAGDEGLEKGLGWLSAHFTVTRNPEGTTYPCYYLYSLERTGRILDTEFIGPDEWYPLGARHLLSAQKADGRWESKADGIDPIATSFALLFLTRATPPLGVAAKRGGDGTLKTGIALPPSQRIYFMLDASGSMIEEMEGRQKFDIARDAVGAVVGLLAGGSEVGLRVYGHRKRSIEKDADLDTQLLIPLRRLDRPAFEGALESLRARGKTPLALSMEQARADLRGASPERPVTVVLLTDGGEDTAPRRDPLKPAEELGKVPGVRFFVVGFDIAGHADWDRQLREIAERGRGRYLPANQAGSLERELRSAVFGIPDDFTVLDGEGNAAAAGKFGESKTLHEGKYRLRTAYGGRGFEESFWINTGATTAVVFDAGKVPPGDGTARPPSVGPPAAGAPAGPAATPGKFCASCGKPLQAGAKFCTECGAKVGG